MQKVAYEELAETWQILADALEIQKFPWKSEWHNRVFCEVLTMCGWSLSEWNIESANRGSEDITIYEDDEEDI